MILVRKRNVSMRGPKTYAFWGLYTFLNKMGKYSENWPYSENMANEYEVF